MDTRQADRPRRDADELLLNGFWKSKRAQSAASVPARPVTPVHQEPAKAPKPQRRVRKDWPPPPVVEDEVVSLAKEHLGANVRTSQVKSNEPPFRGAVDQYPIILESDISPDDAAKLHKKLQAETKAEDSGERRFVLLPRDDTHSPVRDDEEAPRRSYTEPRTSIPTQDDTDRRSPRPYESSAPPLERRKSRQDLPSLQTEMPSFRRSTSAYAYTPTSKQTVKSPSASTGEFLLSPDAAIGRGQSRGYFDLPNKAPSRQSQPNIGTQAAEKRRSGGPSSRPTTPTTPVGEKRNSTGSDAYGRPRQDIPERLTRPQRLSTETGARRSDRAPSAHSHLEPSETSRHRKSSAQPSRRYYDSSDDDQDSSDSDRRRRNHRHHHHRHHTQASLRPDDDRDRHHRSGSKSTTRSSDGKPGSRISSPLASPNISPSQIPPADKNEALRPTNPSSSRESRRPVSRPVSPLSGYPEQPRANATLDPSSSHGKQRHSGSRSRNSSPVAAPGTRSSVNLSAATLPIPIPTRIDLHSPGNTRGSPSIPQYEDRRPSSIRPAASPKPSWQPPPFQPPSEPAHLERPVGSYRRYSQDIDDGTIAPLPPCPRMTLTRGHNDWLTLPRAQAFNICPSCFESTMAPTEFQTHFVMAPPRPSHEGVICDFGSQPWYRIAWLLTRKERRRDLGLISSLAKIAETIPPCLREHEAVRKWYSIIDPSTNHPVRNFDVCFSCVKSIETLLPALQGLFVRTDHTGPPGLPRVCDMRFDSKRFVHYFDALETAADSNEEDTRYAPDMSDFAALARRFALLPECPRDKPISNGHWYLITQLPELTVCPECFQDVILPPLGQGKAIPLMFQKAPVRVPTPTSCQLYSERMRGVFRKAVDGSDYKMLAVRARERRAHEAEFRMEVAEVGKRKGAEKEVRRLEAEWADWE